MRAMLRTAGQLVELSCPGQRLGRIIEDGAAGQLRPPRPETGPRPDVLVRVEESSAAFSTAGWEVLTRGAWRRPGQVILTDACSSGLDLLVTAAGPALVIAARWRPPVTGRCAGAILRARSRLLRRAVLLQYPALWWSQVHGRAPLHASVCTTGPDRPTGQAGPGAVLIAGPGGLGKSTLVNAELAGGATATCDNLCVSDGRTAWGLAEPRRLPAGRAEMPGASRTPGGDRVARGRRMPYGRREVAWPARAESCVPDRIVVVRRSAAPAPTVRSCSPEEAAGALVAGTYMAGELRRYWSFAAALALGTGAGNPHPPVAAIAAALGSALPCHEVTLGVRPGIPLRDLLGADVPDLTPPTAARRER